MRGPSDAFKSDVVLAFHAAGFHSATKPRERKCVSDEDRRHHGDVVGIPGVTIATRNQRHIALSEAATEVQREADAEGNEFWASIQHRKGHLVDDSYATMPLHVLLALLKRALPESVGSSI